MLPKHNVAVFILLAATLILGATAIIIPASRSTLWLILSLFSVLLSPLPVFLGRRIAMNNMHSIGSGAGNAMEAGYFVGAWFVTSAVAWPLLLVQLGYVKEVRQVGWAVLGVSILLASMLCYNAVFNRDEEDDQDEYIY
jgi:hypothetical protein